MPVKTILSTDSPPSRPIHSRHKPKSIPTGMKALKSVLTTQIKLIQSNKPMRFDPTDPNAPIDEPVNHRPAKKSKRPKANTHVRTRPTPVHSPVVDPNFSLDSVKFDFTPTAPITPEPTPPPPVVAFTPPSEPIAVPIIVTPAPQPIPVSHPPVGVPSWRRIRSISPLNAN